MLRELQAAIERGHYLPAIANMVLIDTSSLLDKQSDYYVFDDHITPAAHEKLADAITPWLKR